MYFIRDDFVENACLFAQEFSKKFLDFFQVDGDICRASKLRSRTSVVVH